LSIDALTKEEWRIWVVRKEARRGGVGMLRRRTSGGGMAAEVRSRGLSDRKPKGWVVIEIAVKSWL
jgi:hypothetical protein